MRNQPRFRNPNGVTLKLKNFLALDPSYLGAGMGSFSHLDETLFKLYADRLDGLQELAKKIRANVDRFPSEPTPDEEDFIAPEGRLLVRLHVHRERDRDLRNRKVRQAFQRDGRLPCEVCGMEFGEFYGEVGSGFIEVHHRRPLHVTGRVITRLDDLALVCSNCHRVLHRDLAQTVEGLAQVLSALPRP